MPSFEIDIADAWLTCTVYVLERNNVYGHSKMVLKIINAIIYFNLFYWDIFLHDINYNLNKYLFIW